jgi:PAS domain S-box-containing protein
MKENSSHKIETIVNALLQVSDSVVEVSHEHVLTKVWNAEGRKTSIPDSYLGMKITDIRNGSLFTECDERVAKVFSTGQNDQFYYTSTEGNAPITYNIRIIAIHPDPNYLFIVLKARSQPEGDQIVEDKWKLALDAAGDGIWDANIETGRIFFSAKWHDLFGYDPSEITSRKDWSAKIHPDDVDRANKAIADHIEGRTPSYSAEIRYLCRDGTYKWILSRGVVISRSDDGKPLRFIGTHTDINERKVTEEQYQASAQLLSTLLGSLKDGIIVTDEHNVIIFANQAFCNIYKIDAPPSKVVGTNAGEGLQVRKAFFKESEAFYTKTMEMLNSDHRIFDEEWELKDGKTLGRDYIPVMLDNNKRVGIWKLRDITDLKNTEKRIEQLRLFYEQILNNISADIVVFDDQHRYMFINPIAVRDDELRRWMIGKTDEEYCRYRNRPMSLSQRRRAIFDQVKEEKQIVEFEEKIQNQSGEFEYHLRRMAPVFKENGELDIVIGYGVNITDRVKAEEALKTSKDTFASAFDYSGIGIALISPFGKWFDVNKAICDMTGFSKEELLALQYHDITYFEDVDIDRDLINKMLQHEITTYNIEKRYVSKQKKIILVSLTVSLVSNADDTPKFFIAQVVDITKKKELENEIKRKNTELEATRVSLINKINQLEELSHIIAHNLRGPAGNINILVEAMVAKHKGGSYAEANPLSSAFTEEEALGYIKDSSNSLMNSLQTLMEITEIKLNKDVPYNDCNVPEIIKDITSQLHGIIYEKRAVIIEDLAVKCIKYPQGYFESILYNLVSNALKYSQSDTPPVIWITTRMHNDRVQVIVKDNGIGIDMKKFGDRVFKLNEVFHQGYDSKGVGLYITKTQIESFGGSIVVHSAPNEGSEFIVTL